MSDWRKIETAPMDGTEILAVRGKLQCVISYRSWKPGDSCWETRDRTWRSDHGYHMSPTHWQPLPEPPSPTEE
jgi:hypothetical protein